MESQLHIELINVIKDYVFENTDSSTHTLIEVDSSGCSDNTRSINGSIPDVFFEFNKTLIIGEAKTVADFSTSHSINQYNNYISYCSLKSGSVTFIIAIPWELWITAINYFTNMKKERKLQFKIIILNQFGKKVEI